MARKRRKIQLASSKDEDSLDDTSAQDSAEDNTGKKQRMEEPCIVISDSDGEVGKEENGLPKKRGRLALDRRKSQGKRRIAQMSEEEQLALAVKMSEQEANHVNYSAEEEDELLRKAIEESLHCCGVSDLPERNIDSQTDQESTSTTKHIFPVYDPEELPLSQHFEMSSQDVPKSPVVLLERLSQDIVESNSVILSPNNRDSFSRVASPCQSNTSDFLTMSPLKRLALSPVFPRKSPCSLGLVPRKLFEGISSSSSKLPEDIDDQYSHCSESSQDSASVLCNSLKSDPIEETRTQNQSVGIKNTPCSGNSKMPEARECTSMTPCENSVQVSSQIFEGAVHYYWGVPFCPKGEDPNSYTQVILCQLEVYQKSLKKAQRQLVNKMDFGEPVQLASSRHSERGKGDSQDSCSQEEAEEVEEENLQHGPPLGEGAENAAKLVTRRVSSRRKLLHDSPVHSSQAEEDLSLPQDEPAPSNSQAQFADVKKSENGGVDPVPTTESAVSLNAQNDRSPAVQFDVALDDEEITVCPETQPSPINEELPSRNKSVVKAEIHSIPQSIVSLPPSDEDASLDPSCPQDVECPLCGQHFSQTQIEMHAAYCDGMNKEDKQDKTVLRPRLKTSRRNLAGPADHLPPSDSGKCEKCYLCKSLVPMREYQRHVDSCLQTAELETQGSRRLRSTKESTDRDGRLLSMLEQSEKISAEGSSSAPEPDYINLSPPDEEKQRANMGTEHINISDSPIRSFVSISEATDCLVDFKQQFSRQPGSRGPGKSARGKKRRR